MLYPDWLWKDTWYLNPVIAVNKICWPEGKTLGSIKAIATSLLWQVQCVRTVCTSNSNTPAWLQMSEPPPSLFLFILVGLVFSPPHNPSNQLSMLVYSQHSRINPPSLINVKGNTPPAYTSALTFTTHIRPTICLKRGSTLINQRMTFT